MTKSVLRVSFFFLLNNWSVLEHVLDASDRDMCVLLKECSSYRCPFGLKCCSSLISLIFCLDVLSIIKSMALLKY